MDGIIDAENIETLVANTFEPAEKELLLLLGKARAAKGLTLEEAALLLSIKEKEHAGYLFEAAEDVKLKLYGRRVVLFAPLYLSNFCSNGCLYCGFRSTNSDVARRALTPDEAAREARTLEEMGFNRVLLVAGEDPRYGAEYVASCVRAIYEKTGMRIVHVNAPPMDASELAVLKDAGAGVYQSFQETYHRPTYEKMHPWGPKKDFDYRLGVMDRAMEAGFEDVGIGPLLGLYDWRYDTLATIAHSGHLYDEFGAHAHTISIPRLRPAEGSELEWVPHTITDEELKKVVAVFRLAVPTAGIVVSTREAADLRSELLHTGATQLSAASRTNPGGYGEGEGSLEQFSTNDHRGLPEVIASIISEGYLPSLCTTCYRVGRTGADFTRQTASGGMEKFCQANALLTLKEYLADHARNGIKGDVERVIREGLGEIKDPALRKAVETRLRDIDEGRRDLYF
ncbi:MAG: [FeFe] hydrogenase H-cluster radical SAM maturase HydG [Thermodesulfobacteriota bacterium]